MNESFELNAIKILIIEDSPEDAELIIREIRKENIPFFSKIVDDINIFQNELVDFSPDIILSDYNLQSFTAMDAFLVAKDINPDIPFICVTGALGEERAVEIIKYGFTDYLLKNHLFKLPIVIKRTLLEIEERKKTKQAERQLLIYQENLENLVKDRTLELEEAKKQNELILNSIGEGICHIDLDDRILMINPAAANMLGGGINDFIGLKKHSVMHHSNIDGIKYHPEDCPICSTIANGRSLHLEKEIFWKINGEPFPVEVFCTPILEANLPTGAVLIFKDISERIKTQEVLEKALLEAKYATKAKSEFLANMSHEIRTPMNAIMGFSELLSMTVKDEEIKSQIDIIKISSKHLLDLINDILDLSKIESGKINPEYKPVNLINLITETKELFSRKISEKNIKFDVSIDSALPVYIITDELLLRQILNNLLGNAVKFTNAGEISLSLGGEYLNEIIKKKIRLTISVRDTGIGIPVGEQEKIFEPFVQQSGQDPTVYEGTGLGLSISRRIAEIMGGKILLESEVNKGSKFTVIFDEVESTVSTIESVKDPLMKNQEINFEGKTILICDDNEPNRRLITEVLAGSKANIIQAANGRDGIGKALQFNPDLILMDLKMPVMDGITATDIIKTTDNLKSIPIIAFSATPAELHKDTKLFDDYLLKPVNRSTLLGLLKKYLM